MTLDFYLCIGWICMKTTEVLIKIIICHITANEVSAYYVIIVLLINSIFL